MKSQAIVAMAVLLGGCSTVEQFWAGGPREQARNRPGVTDYRCEGSKTFGLRMEQGAKAAWVVLPDREFRLDAVAGSEGRYSNGRTTLTLKGGQPAVEEGGTPLFSGCAPEKR